MAQNILVIGELDDGAASTTTLELLAGASSLSEEVQLVSRYLVQAPARQLLLVLGLL